MKRDVTLFGRAITLILLAGQFGCASQPPPRSSELRASDNVALAAARAQRADHRLPDDLAARRWLDCAALAYARAEKGPAQQRDAARSEVTVCTRGLLAHLLSRRSDGWRATTVHVAGKSLRVDMRNLSVDLTGPMQLRLSDTVRVPASAGPHFVTPGFGVPLVARTDRCSDQPRCKLLPAEGVYRALTAWVEWREGQVPRLVLADPQRQPTTQLAGESYPLTLDLSAPYASLIASTRLQRLAVWDLLGGRRLRARQGVFLLQDYDPEKAIIVMIHGLGGSPLIWTRLTNRLLATPELRKRYQIWHVVYETNAPLLVDRLRVRELLDRALAQLDPQGKQRSRRDMVLVGHSLGGVIARLLVANSGDVVWKAFSTLPLQRLQGTPADLAMMDKVFHFTADPGVGKAIFLAAPHHGSPLTGHFIGRLAMRIVRPDDPELKALRRVIKANRSGIRPALLKAYGLHGLSSISTLSSAQPVSRVGAGLLPAAGIRYYTIAGNLPGEDPPGDGVVPLASALLPGAQSTTVLQSGHKIYANDQAISAIVDILRREP